jgi:hypothetical protein
MKLIDLGRRRPVLALLVVLLVVGAAVVVAAGVLGDGNSRRDRPTTTSTTVGKDEGGGGDQPGPTPSSATDPTQPGVGSGDGRVDPLEPGETVPGTKPSTPMTDPTPCVPITNVKACTTDDGLGPEG